MELIDIKGIGKKSVEALESKGVFSCEDLAKVLPSKYYNLEEPKAFMPNKKACAIEVELFENPINQFTKRLTITRARAEDLNSGRVITLVWFNQRYAKTAYKQGQKYIVYGNSRTNDFVVVSVFPKEKKEQLLGMFPVYKKYGVSRNVLQNAIFECQDKNPISSIISPHIIQNLGISSLGEAYRNVHVAKSKEQLKEALSRIELENAVEYLLTTGEHVNQNRLQRNAYKNLDYSGYLSLLPFPLTKGQSQSVKDVVSDFKKPVSVNRLIQGEVGSGKTLVAFIAALISVQNGYQVAFLAPTEILARQHYNSFNKYFSKVASSVLITSSAEGRKEAENAVASGKAKLVFGTHVLSLSVEFANLGLVIIDEQQRFGVELRAKLINKSKTRDCLSLTATPIPRSVLLSVSGVLATSIITERPNAHKVETHFVGKSRESDMWQFLKSQKKVFVVCPRIEDDDDPFEEKEGSSVKALEKRLKEVFGNNSVMRVDGSMSTIEQNRVMKEFAAGSAQVLVATTVIEVGIDVPEATAIVVRGADRFGLSTLHQLRGRVGRNGDRAHCFIMLDKKPSDEALERLTYFKEHNNGFLIAEYDFKSRGAGDVFGTRQSGESVLPFSAEILEKARQVVDKMGRRRVDIANN